MLPSGPMALHMLSALKKSIGDLNRLIMVKQRKIFYGWWVVAALFVVGMFGPMARYSITAFFPFISTEFGWSYSEIGLAQSLSLWIYSLFVILSGWMIDRIGSRKTILVGGLFCLVGWLLLSTVRSLWQLYLYYGLVMAIAVSMTHFVPIQATQRKWFTKRAGLAGGILTCAFAVGTAIFSPLLTWMADSSGWRTASVTCALAFSIPIMLVAHFVIRDTPESMGLNPDGKSLELVSHDGQATIKHDWDVKDAVKTPQFWLLFTTYSAMGIALNGLMAHLVMWGVDLGSAVATSGIFITLLNAPSIVTRVGGGWLGDKCEKKKVMIVSAFLSVFIMLWGWQGIHSGNQLLIFALIAGMTYALPVGLFAPYLGDLFGRANVGSLFGILTMGWGLIGGFGPMLWGIIFDTTGSYNPACLMSAGCYAFALIALLLIRSPVMKI